MVILSLQVILKTHHGQRIARRLHDGDMGQPTPDAAVADITASLPWHQQRVQEGTEAHGSFTAYLLNVLRFTLCLILLGMSTYATDIAMDDGRKGRQTQEVQTIFYVSPD